MFPSPFQPAPLSIDEVFSIAPESVRRNAENCAGEAGMREPLPRAANAEHPTRRGSGRLTVQFQREKVSPRPSYARSFWKGRGS